MVEDTRKYPRLRHVAFLILLFAGIGTAIVYGWNWKKIEQAIELRRTDQLSNADTALGKCWSLPGQQAAIQMEWHLGAVQQGDLRNETSLQKSAELKSEQSWLILESLCKGNMAVFRWNEARGYAEEMLERRPSDAGALWLRGRCWVKMQQETRALDDFRQAVRLVPSRWQYKLSLAELLQQQGNNSESIDLYLELVMDRQYDARVLLGLSRCLHDAAKQWDRACRYGCGQGFGCVAHQWRCA